MKDPEVQDGKDGLFLFVEGTVGTPRMPCIRGTCEFWKVLLPSSEEDKWFLRSRWACFDLQDPRDEPLRLDYVLTWFYHINNEHSRSALTSDAYIRVHACKQASKHSLLVRRFTKSNTVNELRLRGWAQSDLVAVVRHLFPSELAVAFPVLSWTTGSFWNWKCMHNSFPFIAMRTQFLRCMSDADYVPVRFTNHHASLRTTTDPRRK